MTDSENPIVKLKKRRSGHKSVITKVANWYNDNVNIETDICQFEARLEQLNKAFSKYDDLQTEIELLDESDKDREPTEEQYFILHAHLKNKINSFLLLQNGHAQGPPAVSPKVVVQPQAVPQPQVRLPELHIKVFKGDILEWTSFYQLFTALVGNNPALCDVQKFMYLKSFLKDEPLKLIDTLAVTNENFATATNILKNRYENKIALINNHLATLLETPTLTKSNMQNLREFTTSCKRNLKSLENLQLSFEERWNLLVVHLIERKLDFVSKKAYEADRDFEVFPTVEDFFEFLDNRCAMLENLASVEGTMPKKTSHVSFHAKVNTQNNIKSTQLHSYVDSHSNDNCTFCHEQHRIYECTKFKSLNVNSRHNFIKSKGFCFNCLGSQHQSGQCKSTKTCSICSQRHHSLLHLSPKNNNNFQTNVQTQHSNVNPPQNKDIIMRNQCVNPLKNAEGNVQSKNKVSHFQGQRLQQQENDFQQASSSQSVAPSEGSAHKQASNNFQVSQSLSAVATKTSHVLLATALVYIYNAQGVRTPVRALLDSGSQNSFLTQELVNKLGKETYDKQLHISGLSQIGSTTNKMIDLVVHSKACPRQKFNLSCAVLPSITCELPQVDIDISKLKIPQNIRLADEEFGSSRKVDMLIGADLYYNLLLPGVIQLGRHLPVLQETHFGWIVAGCVPQTLLFARRNALVNTCPSLNDNVSLFLQNDAHVELNNLLEKFWKVEELPHKTPLSPDDEKAEQLFLSTTKILPDGSYQVDLPLKSENENEKLGDSFYIARTRFLNLERKFEKNPTLKRDYTRFIDEYVDLGHANYIDFSLTKPESEKVIHKYFLPHHGIIRENNISTKIRVVFDASCKTSSGVSLNDVMLTGFQVQPNLFDILCTFRSFNFILTSDIEKMYRGIKVNPEHRFLLNILWRREPNEELKCLELSTVTYGTNCAPYLATRVLNDLALKNREKFPLASTALLKHTYVDDVIFGCDTFEKLEEIYFELNELLNSAGFRLHKWCSNSLEFLNKISQEQILEYDLNFDESPSSILGLKWNPISDVFVFKPPENLLDTQLTKRKILSVVAKMYDPLGLVSCVIVVGKLIMQKLWCLKFDWDAKITDTQIISLWKNFIEDISHLSQIKISRNLFLNKTKLKIQIQGFADASMLAYAACVYVQTLYSDGTVSCNLVSSKSRVAPIKTISLPRLELCAMLLLSKLVQNLLNIFKDSFTVDSVHLWTDSTIALNWIQAHPSRWSVFVSNRVSQIQELTSKFTWRHIDTKRNPADLSTRGHSVQKLINCSFWFHGPEFLLSPEDFDLKCFKPNLNAEISDSEVEIAICSEERKTTLASVNDSQTLNNFWTQIFSKFSTFSKLQRVIAYCLRFIENSKKNAKKLSGTLSVRELENALHFIFKTLQKKYFMKEISVLKAGKLLSNKSLLPFKPFFCESDGFLRVGGRLENAELPFDQKHPILLPSHDLVVSLLIKLEHLRLGHAGAQTLLSNMRLKYWPLNGLREAKKVIRNCITCYRFRAQPAQQIMSDLPKDRVQMCRPFQKVGVDFGGPFFIKSSRLRKAPLSKCYISVFVCMVTKAVHIELVSSLSTDAFLACLNRFISRRGNPSVIYSDHATNFQGARNQLFEIYKLFKNQSHLNRIHDFLAAIQIEWKFIPPKSPHWGGIWEAAIKSVKFHMVRIIGNAHLTFEELTTVINRIEAILNSRPLCALSNDPTDLQPLTPGHFLIGTSLTAFPEKDVTNIPENRLTFWKRLTQMQQTFWKRWSVEYLNRLQNRPKWLIPRNDVKVNDVVLLKDDNIDYPLKWPLAKVLETFPGPDGKTRMVTLKTADGVYRRSITKICPLPNDDSQIPN